MFLAPWFVYECNVVYLLICEVGCYLLQMLSRSEEGNSESTLFEGLFFLNFGEELHRVAFSF